MGGLTDWWQKAKGKRQEIQLAEQKYWATCEAKEATLPKCWRCGQAPSASSTDYGRTWRVTCSGYPCKDGMRWMTVFEWERKQAKHATEGR